MKTLFSKHIIALSLFMVTAACSSSSWLGEKEGPPLPGERISVFELEQELESDDIVLNAQGFVVSDPWANYFWPQAGGYPNHAMQHLALGPAPLKKAWQVDIGRGGNDNLPLTAQPVLANDIIYTLDSHSELRAFSTDKGKLLWKKDMRSGRRGEAVISGGIGIGEGRLYVTNGQNIVFALDPESGDVLWRQDVLSPVRAAPTILDGRVYITTLDSTLTVLNAEDGTFLWEHKGLGESAGLLGNASPAADKQIAVVGYSSGEVFALRVENGSIAWSDNLSSVRAITASTRISDIKALPIIDKSLVIVGSYGGRMTAINKRTGNRVWQREISISETPWVAGNHIFTITNGNKLVALSRDKGSYSWVKTLREFVNQEDKIGPVGWTSPVLAGDRLILFNTVGEAVEVDPNNGDILNTWDIGTSVSIAPIVAGETLYVLDDKGNLRAYR